MSKFWGGSSSEEESSDQETESSSQDEAPQKKSAFFLDSDSDDDSVKRVVRSKRDKQWDELKSAVNKVKQEVKKGEWGAVQTDFAALNKVLTKSKNLIQKEGLPNFYIGVLVLLEDSVEENSDKEKLKAMSKNNAKGYNSMRQLLRKHNKDYAEKIAAYRKNPPADEDDDDDKADADAESDDDASVELPPAKPAGAKAGASKWFSSGKKEDDDDDDDDDDSHSGSYQDSEDDVKSKWFVKDDTPSEKKNEGAKREKSAKSTDKKSDKEKEKAKPQKEEKVEWTPEKIAKKLEDIVALRGRRNTDSSAQVGVLQELLRVSKSEPSFGYALPVAVMIQLLAAHLDLVQTHTAAPVSLWQNCMNLLSNILTTTVQHNVKLDSIVALTIDLNVEDPGKSVVAGNILAFLERLDDELTKLFQALDAQSPDYPARAQDEQNMIVLIQNVQKYYAALGDHMSTVRCAQRLLERLYYKTGSDEKAALIPEIASLVFEQGDERLKSRAMLCLIFNHAVHDRFQQARDLMLMSHLQDTIHQTQDISTQILFNRTMTQLGLCAFRLGLITEAHACLMDISGKIKELLAQGLQRFQDRTPEQEKLERARLIPAHMHINADLIEASHLISAMLLEVPNRASGVPYEKKRVISKLYRRLSETAPRFLFTGPPETVRDVVVAAGTALSKGDWKQSAALLFGLKVWSTLPGREAVLAMLRQKLQETGLKTYILTYGHVYESISLVQLAELFELPVEAVHAQLSRLIVSEDLTGAIDQLSRTLVMHRVEPSRLQLIALQYAEKASIFVDSNERLLDSKSGSYNYKGYDKNPSDARRGQTGQRGRPTTNQQRRQTQQRN